MNIEKALEQAQAAAAEIKQIDEMRRLQIVSYEDSDPERTAATEQLIAANSVLPWAKRVKPYEGGWFINSDGQRMFLMPPYPGVDY